MRFLVLASFVVVLAGVSLGCGATPDSGDRDGSETSDRPGGSRPPQSTLSYGGETVSGALGTYCWESVCVDKIGIPVNEEALTVPAGSTLTFAYGGKKLDSLSVSADRIGRGNHLERIGRVSVLVPDEGSKGYQEIRLQSNRSGNRARFAAELPAEKYVVSVFVRVPQGDALYGFRVVVE
jgi:hypothetical protein